MQWMAQPVLHVHCLTLDVVWLLCKSGAAALGRSSKLKMDPMHEMQHDRLKCCQLKKML
jgi:hypothetical protein